MNNEKDLAKLVEQVKKADNILVAVSANPSIDELTSALGLTLMLNKNDRRAVAIFSGEIPNALQFLKPDETFDRNVDGLRDFIITLDSKKADRVVAKAEDGMVKVYITPSGTIVSKNDLEFSQGDYNIDLVLTLGVSNKDTLDKALSAHGRILHNAAVVSLMIGEKSSNLGGINIRANKASSYAELLSRLPVLLDKDLADSDETAMDKSVATALLTGVVAVTNRFSNNRTTAEIMSLASDLMNAGANQQLVATELSKLNKTDKFSVSKEGKTPAPVEADKKISLRPDEENKSSNVIDLKSSHQETEQEEIYTEPTQEYQAVEKTETKKKPKLPQVQSVKIGPDFENLEKYNEEQLAAERQDTAADVLDLIPNPIPEPPQVGQPEPLAISEDDQLAQQLDQARQAQEIAASIPGANEPAISVSPVVEPDPTVVFGKEIPGERSYLQDPSTAWERSSSVGGQVDPSLPSASESYIAGSPRVTLSPIEPQPVAAPEPIAPDSAQSYAPLPPAQPSDLGFPPMPDFQALNIAPPVPPTPPNFAMPMPPLPSADIYVDQPQVSATPYPELAPQASTSEPVPFVPEPVQPAPSISPIPTNTPVMPDQVYPQPVDNAQFVIPE